MNQKQKLGYMALGAGIMALGIIIGQFITPNIEAQNNGVVDHIVCRSLTVVDRAGRSAISLSSNRRDNALTVYDGMGQPGVILQSRFREDYTFHNESNRLMLLDHTTQLVSILITSDGKGKLFRPANALVVKDKTTGLNAISLRSMEDGNRMTVMDKAENVKWVSP